MCLNALIFSKIVNQLFQPLIHTFGNWPWESRKENGLANPKYRFTLTSIRRPKYDNANERNREKFTNIPYAFTDLDVLGLRDGDVVAAVASYWTVCQPTSTNSGRI